VTDAGEEDDDEEAKGGSETFAESRHFGSLAKSMFFDFLAHLGGFSQWAKLELEAFPLLNAFIISFLPASLSRVHFAFAGGLFCKLAFAGERRERS